MTDKIISRLKELDCLKGCTIEKQYSNKISISSNSADDSDDENYLYIWISVVEYKEINRIHLENIVLSDNLRRKGICTAVLKLLCEVSDDVVIKSVMSDEMRALCEFYNFEKTISICMVDYKVKF